MSDIFRSRRKSFRFIFAVIVILFLSLNDTSQTERDASPPATGRTVQPLLIVSENSEFYQVKWLERDYRQAAIVAYVHSIKVIGIGRSDESTNCDNFPQRDGGYCSFTMLAEIKELYKGNLKSKTLEYSESGEAPLIQSKEQFLGRQIVFLEEYKDISGKTVYQVIENSSRDIAHDIIKKMRKIGRKKS